MKFINNILFVCLAATVLLSFSGCSKVDNNGAADNISGVGGSLARFTTAGNYMYVVDAGNLYSFDISTPQHPRQVAVTNVGFNVETIYPFKDKLFIGSQDAMYIYSLTDPAKPSQLGVASHLRACDPVVANDSVAYVTVRTGSTCGGNINALNVYDVRDPLNPFIQSSINLGNPRGLALKGDVLYLCDDIGGLLVMGLDNPYEPFELKRFTGDKYFDVIALDDVLICMIEGGMLIYDIENPFSPVLLSRITN